jgi:hypothetical protein
MYLFQKNHPVYLYLFRFISKNKFHFLQNEKIIGAELQMFLQPDNQPEDTQTKNNGKLYTFGITF